MKPTIRPFQFSVDIIEAIVIVTIFATSAAKAERILERRLNAKRITYIGEDR